MQLSQILRSAVKTSRAAEAAHEGAVASEAKPNRPRNARQSEAEPR
jgi:hypothetical protein